jgi:uncharacterized protein YcnI
MRHMNKGLITLILALAFFAAPAAAHVTLDPNEAVVGWQQYGINIPNEKDMPTVELRLIVPDGVDVMGILPIAGWTHTEKTVPAEKTASMDDESPTERITEITWSGGKINPGEFMTFRISTRYEGNPAELTWKAYQKYSDGTIVAWDGTGDEPAPKVTILSESKIDSVANAVNSLHGKSSSNSATWLSVFAVLLSVTAIIASFMKRHR